MIAYIKCLSNKPSVKVERVVLDDILSWIIMEKDSGDYIGEIWKMKHPDDERAANYHSSSGWSDYNFETLMIRVVRSYYSI